MFINSVPLSAVTDIKLTTTGSNRNYYAIGTGPSDKVVPVSRGYEIELTRSPARQDDFRLPSDGFSLGIMDASSHTIYRGCAVSRIDEKQFGGKQTVIKIVSNEKWEFNDYKYFGGAECTAEI